MTTSTHVIIALTFAIAVASLTGCASTQTARSPMALDGTSWQLVSWSHVGINPREFEITAEIYPNLRCAVVSKTSSPREFKFPERVGNRIAGKSAVNRYFGPLDHTTSGTFRPGLVGSTMMAGPEMAMQAEQVFIRLLAEARRYGIVDGQLVVFADDGEAILTFAPAP